MIILKTSKAWLFLSVINQFLMSFLYSGYRVVGKQYDMRYNIHYIQGISLKMPERYSFHIPSFCVQYSWLEILYTFVAPRSVNVAQLAQINNTTVPIRKWIDVGINVLSNIYESIMRPNAVRILEKCRSVQYTILSDTQSISRTKQYITAM